jgi:hypothetical protein
MLVFAGSTASLLQTGAESQQLLMRTIESQRATGAPVSASQASLRYYLSFLPVL